MVGGQQPQPHDAVDAHALILGVYVLMEFGVGAQRGDARPAWSGMMQCGADFSRHFDANLKRVPGERNSL